MPQSQPPPENPEKAEESVDPQAGMDRFKRLAKGLLGVPREKVAEAEREFKDRRD